jgi:hypothetical protein
VPAAVRRGGTRFLLGITYRAIALGRSRLARGYAKSLSHYSSPILSVAVIAVTWIPGLGFIFRGLRSQLKRWV